MCVVLNVSRVQHIGQSMVRCTSFVISHVYGVSFHDPQQGREYFVHALTISYGRMHLAPYEQYIQHHGLGGGLTEVYVVWHASFDILEYLGTELFVGAEGCPW